jgi:ADP-heptose:LPS heptosyltransferase
MPAKLVLQANLSPGDILTLTAAVYSLHRTYPGDYLTDVRTSASEIWQNNPDITPLDIGDPAVRRIDMHYPSIHRSNQEPVTFIAGYTEFLGQQLGRPLACRINRPVLYLSEAELAMPCPIQEQYPEAKLRPFWLVCVGTKRDYTAKQWPVEHYQEVVDRTRGWIVWVQIGAREHDHPPLRGVIDMRGKTNHRQLVRLAYHACGGLGPSTYLQHLMAAWQRPYILLLGGREPAMWQSYPLQHTLHTIGCLPCCAAGACWRSRVVPLGDGSDKDRSLCARPVLGWSRPFAECMGRISPEEVVCLLRRIAR